MTVGRMNISSSTPPSLEISSPYQNSSFGLCLTGSLHTVPSLYLQQVPPMHLQQVPPMHRRPVPPMHLQQVPHMHHQPVPPMHLRQVPSIQPIPSTHHQPVPSIRRQPTAALHRRKAFGLLVVPSSFTEHSTVPLEPPISISSTSNIHSIVLYLRQSPWWRIQTPQRSRPPRFPLLP
jgi:hypothetical protein